MAKKGIPHRIEDPKTGEVRAIKVGDQPCKRTGCQLHVPGGCGKRHYGGRVPSAAWGDWNCPGYIGKPAKDKKILPREGPPPKPTKITKGQQVKLEVDL